MFHNKSNFAAALSDQFRTSANWRNGQAKRFKHDGRNAVAAQRLTDLESQIVISDATWEALAPLVSNPTCLAAISETNRDVGFRTHPRDFVVWLHEFLVPLLTPLVERGGILFRSPRGTPYPVRKEISGQMKTAIRNARRRSGIEGISPYTARHTVSTQLVVNGVHAHIKDQILGHAVDDMSRHYTHVPQATLLDAINTLPIIKVWAELPWMKDPVGMSKRYVEGMGARNDLKHVQKQSS